MSRSHFGQGTSAGDARPVQARGSDSMILARGSQRRPLQPDPRDGECVSPEWQIGPSRFSPQSSGKANKWVGLRCTLPAIMTGKTKSPATETAPPPPATQGSNLEVTLDVEPRKPRLAWQGMDRREAAVSVPTQVVEIVRPGKAQAGDDLLPGLSARARITDPIGQPREPDLPPRWPWTAPLFSRGH